MLPQILSVAAAAFVAVKIAKALRHPAPTTPVRELRQRLVAIEAKVAAFPEGERAFRELQLLGLIPKNHSEIMYDALDIARAYAAVLVAAYGPLAEEADQLAHARQILSKPVLLHPV